VKDVRFLGKEAEYRLFGLLLAFVVPALLLAMANTMFACIHDPRAKEEGGREGGRERPSEGSLHDAVFMSRDKDKATDGVPLRRFGCARMRDGRVLTTPK
jgi:hypothetical protein